MPEETTANPPLPVLGVIPAAWTPPTGGERPVWSHAGFEIPADLLFFVPPPAEIGDLWTAYTTLKADGKTDNTKKRVGGVFGGLFLGLFLIFYISYRGSFSPPIYLYPIAGVVGAVIGFIAAKPKHRCSYVGTQGIALYTYGNAARYVKKEEIFFYQHAVELRVQQTNRYVNGGYASTDYKFTWADHLGKKVFALNGSHRSKEGNPPADDLFHFALSAERGWSEYLYAALLPKIQEGEAVRFNLKGANHVLIAQEYIELHLGKKVERMEKDEIGAVEVPGKTGASTTLGLLKIKDGQVTVARSDAKKGVLGIGKSGVFSFPYAELGNARLFFFLMQRLHNANIS